MFKKKILTFLIVLLIVFILLVPQTVRAVVISEQKVIYNLPYPGLLPDHPLYFFKIVRDRISEFTTRDYLKQAELYLLLSDKRLAMSTSLAAVGKSKLAFTTLAKSEKYFLKIPLIVITSKKQGAGATDDFINRLKMSNVKHREMEQEMLKKLPQGETDSLNQILKINQDIKSELAKL